MNKETYWLNRSKPLVIFLAVLTGFIGLGALISGGMLILSPSGSLLGFTPALLKGTPFKDFLIPGIILFLFLGAYSAAVTYSIIARPGWRWPDIINPFKKLHWAWAAALANGIIIFIWISVETILLGYISFLQPAILGWSILILILVLLPLTQRHFSRR
jgi:hypothetical protein